MRLFATACLLALLSLSVAQAQSLTGYGPSGTPVATTAQILPPATPTGAAGYGTIVAIPSDEAAMRQGNGFIGSTSGQSVASGSYFNIVLTNTSTTKYMIVVQREFDNSSNTVANLVAMKNPTALTSPTTVTPGNRGGATTASIATLTYNVSSTQMSGGVVISTDLVMPNLASPPVTVFMIPPGQSRGFSLGGVGGGLSATGTFDAIFAWSEITTP